MAVTNKSSILVTPEKLEDEDFEEGKTLDAPVDSAIKLKGVFWPGMDLFDSATPEQKKRRNQKKEVKVLKNLMAISEEVVPVQVSYYANGEVRESRDIFGPLSDNEDFVSTLLVLFNQHSPSSSPKSYIGNSGLALLFS